MKSDLLTPVNKIVLIADFDKLIESVNVWNEEYKLGLTFYGRYDRRAAWIMGKEGVIGITQIPPMSVRLEAVRLRGVYDKFEYFYHSYLLRHFRLIEIPGEAKHYSFFEATKYPGDKGTEERANWEAKYELLVKSTAEQLAEAFLRANTAVSNPPEPAVGDGETAVSPPWKQLMLEFPGTPQEFKSWLQAYLLSIGESSAAHQIQERRNQYGKDGEITYRYYLAASCWIDWATTVIDPYRLQLIPDVVCRIADEKRRDEVNAVSDSHIIDLARAINGKADAVPTAHSKPAAGDGQARGAAVINQAQYLSQLRDQIANSFNLEELQQLAFNLGLDWEELEGRRKTMRVQDLIVQLGRNSRLEELVDLVREKRPHVNWPDVPPTK